VTTAATVPRLCKCLTLKSQRHDPLIPNDWSDDTFDDIDWKSVRSSIKRQPYGQRFQISKFAHNWTLTLHQWATQDNSIDRRCFKCGAWKEDIDHVLRCPSNLHDAAWTKAKTQFLNHLAKCHTPAPMATVIMSTLDQWFSSLPPDLVPCLPTGPTKPAKLHPASTYQQSLCSLELHWMGTLSMKPPHTPVEVMHCGVLQSPSTRRLVQPKSMDAKNNWRNMADLPNNMVHSKWHCMAKTMKHNGLLHSRRHATKCLESMKKQNFSYVNDAKSRLLHGQPLEQILTWTKSHLDAYLAMAEVITECWPRMSPVLPCTDTWVVWDTRRYMVSQ
jgi:hypothetical protein